MALARPQPMPQPIDENVAAPVAQLLAERPTPVPPKPAQPTPANFRELVRLFAEKKEGVLEYHLSSSVRLVRFEPGLIEISPLPAAPANLANRVGSLLSEWTGRRWVVGISGVVGQETLADADRARADASLQAARAHPVVQAVMAAFPGAAITEVRDLGQIPRGADDAADLEYSGSVDPGESGEPISDSGDEP
jgi:DNA polymerase-3 subunit gamma/tau